MPQALAVFSCEFSAFVRASASPFDWAIMALPLLPNSTSHDECSPVGVPSYVPQAPAAIAPTGSVTTSGDPVTANGVDCTGAAVAVTGVGVVQSVPHPTAVQLVKLCDARKDVESTVMCVPNTTDKVLVVVAYDDITGLPVAPVAYNFPAMTAYAGVIANLVACPDNNTESDAIEMCDNGVAFLRWIVKANGAPTGASFDTNMSGAIYTPTGTVTFGSCLTVDCPPVAPVGVVTTWG